MAIECTSCATEQPVVGYRRPDVDQKRLLVLLILMIAGSAFSVVGLWQVLVHTSVVTDIAEELETQFTETTPFPDARIRDGARLLVNTALLTFGALIVATLSIPIRYTIYAFELRGGHPHTLLHIRRTAIHQMILGILSVWAIVYLFGNTETLRPNVTVGIQSAIAPAIWWYTFTPWVRQFFSDHKTKRLV